MGRLTEQPGQPHVPATESLLDLWGRVWDAAWEIDDIRGDSAATTFAAEELRRLGDDVSTAPAVAALAAKLEERLESGRDR